MILNQSENGELDKIGNVWEGFGARPPDFHPDLKSGRLKSFKSCRPYQNTDFIQCFQRRCVTRNRKCVAYDFNGLQAGCHTLPVTSCAAPLAAARHAATLSRTDTWLGPRNHAPRSPQAAAKGETLPRGHRTSTAPRCGCSRAETGDRMEVQTSVNKCVLG